MGPHERAAGVLMDAIRGIRAGEVEATSARDRQRVIDILTRYVELLPMGDTMLGHHITAIATLVSLSYAVGRLDGARDMVESVGSPDGPTA